MIHMGILIKQLALFRIIAWRFKLIQANAVFECCVCRLAAPRDTGVAGTGIAIACCPTGRGQTRTTQTDHTGRWGWCKGIISLRASVFSDSRTNTTFKFWKRYRPFYRTADPIAANRNPGWYFVFALTCSARPLSTTSTVHTKRLYPRATWSVKPAPPWRNCYTRLIGGTNLSNICWIGILARAITEKNIFSFWWTSESNTYLCILIIIKV